MRSGPGAKKVKKDGFKPNEKLTKEELKKNRQQRKKDLKKSRQEAERKDMYEIINQSKHMWGDLRRYMSTHTHTLTHRVGDKAVVCIAAVGSILDVCANRKNCEKDLKKKLLRELRDLIHGKVKQVRLFVRNCTFGFIFIFKPV